MARYDCVRCGQESNTLSEPHLCKDVEARLREAERRAAVPCQGRGSLDSWLARMDATEGRPRKAGVNTWNWVVNHSGILVDPEAPDFVPDPASARMLASRSAS